MSNPIFILSQSPRSGSTWLQRVLTSTGDVLIWGEGGPYLFPLQTLWSDVASLPPALNASAHTRNKYTLDVFRKHKADMWQAVLHPEALMALTCHKEYIEKLYGASAISEGFDRWGFKETNWEGFQLDTLLYQWPDAKIILLTRRFGDSFRSQFPQGGGYIPQHDNRREDIKLWVDRWVVQAQQTVDHRYSHGSPVIHVRYEDLKDAKQLAEVVEWCGLSASDPEQHSTQISTTVHRDPDLTPMDLQHFQEQHERIKTLSEQLGYKETLT